MAISTIGTDALASAAVTQAKVSTGVVGSGPAFSVYMGSSQTISTDTTTKVQFNTAVYDTASCFNTSLYRFVPNVAGYYQISAAVQVGSSATSMDYKLYKNGSIYKQVFSTYPTTVSGQSGSAVVYLNGSTDYIEMYVYLSTGQILNTNQVYTYFQGSMVRAA